MIGLEGLVVDQKAFTRSRGNSTAFSRRALTGAAARYCYIAPLFNQAKTIAWDVLKLAHPPHEAELRCDLKNGARITLFGSDNPDRLRGMGFDGVVLDEFADMSPSLWGSVVRPSLADRTGYAVVIGTVRGRGSLWQTYQRALSDPSWFTALLPASKTQRLSADELADAAKILSPEMAPSAPHTADKRFIALAIVIGSLAN